MAYSLNQRFPPEQKYYRLLDPGAYQQASSSKTQLNKAPFLSKTPRCTMPENKLWTHTIYNTNILSTIPSCTALKSNLPRFPYESSSKDDFENFLCQCDNNICTCPTNDNEEEEEEIVCQGKIHRHIYKGPPPRSFLGEGLSMPSKQDHGFVILPNGSKKRIKSKITNTQPPFYNTNIYESTSYYHGCKWSRWTSNRCRRVAETTPGPAEYMPEKKPLHEIICGEKFRAHKRKTSKQLRFIEMVQRRNIIDGYPGPGSYSLNSLNTTQLQHLGPKAERFIKYNYDEQPGPADYCIKREFELPSIPQKFCHAKLTVSAPFGNKATRLKSSLEEGPSPASYELSTKTYKLTNCSTAPFGISTIRFKEPLESNEDEVIDSAELYKNFKSDTQDICSLPTWEFRSQTIRMKPLFKNPNEPSPADFCQSKMKIQRSVQLQSIAPFFSSEHRFRRWYNWIAVHGADNTPGPSYYCLEKYKCLPAVHHGPLIRCSRFTTIIPQTPAPNEYDVGGGIEIILTTHNQRLKDNIEKQKKFRWKPRMNSQALSFEEKENILLNKSIALLDTKEID